MLNDKGERKLTAAFIDRGHYFPDNRMCGSSSLIQIRSG